VVEAVEEEEKRQNQKADAAETCNLIPVKRGGVVAGRRHHLLVKMARNWVQNVNDT